jgi:hypothetical protein
MNANTYYAVLAKLRKTLNAAMAPTASTAWIAHNATPL